MEPVLSLAKDEMTTDLEKREIRIGTDNVLHSSDSRAIQGF